MKILKIFNDWVDIKNICRNTVNKKHTESEPSEGFKRDLVISEHSPLREWRIRWHWDAIKSWVATHYSRHSWESYIGTQRSDRTGVDRNELRQDELVPLDGSANAQHLIDTMRKRLCYCSSLETRELAEGLKLAIKEQGEDAIADALVPNCVYRCGCPEFGSCGLYKRLYKYTPTEDLTSIPKRYAIYNNHLYGKLYGEGEVNE